MSREADIQDLPGADLIRQGIGDLATGTESIPGLLVAIGAHRIKEKLPELGTDHLPQRPERRLYRILQEMYPRGGVQPAQCISPAFDTLLPGPGMPFKGDMIWH